VKDASENLEQDLSEDDWACCLRVLRAASRDLSLGENRIEFKTLVSKINRRSRRQGRGRLRAQDRAADHQTRMQATLSREANLGREAGSGENLPAIPDASGDGEARAFTLRRPQNCYACRQPYSQCHPVYHRLCPSCVTQHLARRNLRLDMSGRIAIVTGGRVKIGYHTALRLLRDGAQVIVTTRFPADALSRYKEEPDFDAWSDRLKIFALNLCYLLEVEYFCDWVAGAHAHLDVLINNAAQTVARPPVFYEHLMEAEHLALTAPAASVVALEPPAQRRIAAPSAVVPVDPIDASYFPAGEYDRDRQQLDRRPANSWTAKLHEVPTVELIETHLINAMAPYVLCARLRRSLSASPFERRFIVNVSSAEGQFSRHNKTAHHPHTNMTKAALNMMTRTSGADFARDQIFMTSVDPGWISNMNPQPKAEAMHANGFAPPLDMLDAAARVLHPVYDGIRLLQTPHYGVFLKDYAPCEW
jgi:NAD(P)-dependent dehydrogenase (short-subunit alcohol dehydrogenase family)